MKKNKKKSRIEIGERIKQFRKSIGITQQSIADDLNLNRSVITLIEKGESTPTIYLIEHLVKKYKLSASWLFTGKGEMISEARTDTGTELELDILEKVMEAIEQTSDEKKILLTPTEKAIVIKQLYEEIMNSKKDNKKIVISIKPLMSRIRQIKTLISTVKEKMSHG